MLLLTLTRVLLVGVALTVTLLRGVALLLTVTAVLLLAIALLLTVSTAVVLLTEIATVAELRLLGARGRDDGGTTGASDVVGLGAALTVNGQLELDWLTVGQGTEAIGLDGGVVDEHIALGVGRRGDETVSLVVHPLLDVAVEAGAGGGLGLLLLELLLFDRLLLLLLGGVHLFNVVTTMS